MCSCDGELGVAARAAALLLEVASIVPDGVSVFFTSYDYMETIINRYKAFCYFTCAPCAFMFND